MLVIIVIGMMVLLDVEARTNAVVVMIVRYLLNLLLFDTPFPFPCKAHHWLHNDKVLSDQAFVARCRVCKVY